MSNCFGREVEMTDKIILELTLEELKTLDKHIEYNEETKSVFDKIKYAYPLLKMTPQEQGEYAVVSYNDKTYYRLMNETTFSWYKRIVVIPSFPTPSLVMVDDAETERLLEGLYYNHIEVKKEKEMIRQNLKTSLEELANGDVRPIDDVIEEAKEEQTKTPCEIAYKDWWGEYPSNTWQCDVDRWVAFQAGYNATYKKPEEPVSFAPKEIKELVRESVKWCEEHPNENPLDWVKPQTPEQVSDGLKEAFREAVKQGVVSSTKSKTLTDLIYRWWSDVFTTHSDWDMETSIEDLVDQIELFLPKEQSSEGSQNAYVECTVEGFNDCLTKIKGKLR